MNLKNATLEAIAAEMGRRMEAAARTGDMHNMADMLDCIEDLAFYGIIALGYDLVTSLEGTDIFHNHLKEKVTCFISTQDFKANRL